MPLSSSLAPGFIRLTYSGTLRPHHQLIPINFASPPAPGTQPDLKLTDTTTVNWRSALSDYVTTAFAKQFAPATVFGLADIYEVDPTSGVRTFIDSYNVDLVGTSISDQVPLVEAVWSYKTTAGKPLKVYAMEGVYTADVKDVGALPPDDRVLMNTQILSGLNFFYGRHDAYPLSFVSFITKENDILRKNALVNV